MTDLKIVEFKPSKTATLEDCMGMFQRAAERDEPLAAAALVVVHSDGSVGTEFVSANALFPLIGGVEYLKARLLQKVEQE